MTGETLTCADLVQHGASGWRKVTIRFAGDAADGVVQAARLVARGFATQGFPIQLKFQHPTAIRAEPGSPGGYLSVDLKFLIPAKATGPRLSQDPSPDQVQGLVLFRPGSLTRAARDLVPGAWILMDADALSAKQLAGDLDQPILHASNIAVELQPVSFLNLPRELDMDRHWRRNQRLLTPKEQNRCRAFTPVGWIAGKFGLPPGAWDLWVGDRFRNHPPLRDTALTLIRAGYQAGENISKETVVGPFSMAPLMQRGVWRMATAYEALVIGLSQAARSSGQLVHLCVPLDPVLTPLIRAARTMTDHGLRIIEGATPIESVRNALGVFLAGGIGVSVGASSLDAGFTGEILRPHGRWIRLEEVDGNQVPDLQAPSSLERFGKQIFSLPHRATATYQREIWQLEEPIGLATDPMGVNGEVSDTKVTMDLASPPQASPSSVFPSLALVPSPLIFPCSSEDIPDWCPGCGNFAIFEHLRMVIEGQGNQEHAILAAPGCAGKITRGMGLPSYLCPPGAAFGIARGVCAAWPTVNLWIVAGDGELSGPSLGGVIRAIHENQPIKIIFVNNETAASADGLETLLTPTHSWNSQRDSEANGPMPLAGLMLVAGAGYYARSLDVEVETLTNTLKGAADHQGTAIVEVWQNCKIHNDGNHDDMIDRQISRRHRIDLLAERPIAFDFEPERCLIWTGADFEPRVKLSVAPEKVVIHDPRTIPTPMAVALVSMGVVKPAEVSCFGVVVARDSLRQKPHNGIREARSESWLHGPDAWIIPDYPEFPSAEETA